MKKSLVVVVGTIVAAISIAACGPTKPSPSGLDGAAVPPPSPTATAADLSGSGSRGGALDPTQQALELDPTPTPTE